MSGSSIGVVLLGFGSPRTAAEIPAFLASVTGGPPRPQHIADLERRYRAAGGSDLHVSMARQAEALQRVLIDRGKSATVVVAMRHSAPHLDDVLAAFDPGTDIIAVPMSPQDSGDRAAGVAALVRAARARGMGASVAPPFFDDADFIAALAARCEARLRDMAPSPAVLFTAHSLPHGWPGASEYAAAVAETARRVADLCAITRARWRTVFQSVPRRATEPWLGPDLLATLEVIARTGIADEVLIVPVQFLSDHLEVRYDIDVEAHAVASSRGLVLRRTATLDDDPLLVAALAAAVTRAVPVGDELTA